MKSYWKKINTQKVRYRTYLALNKPRTLQEISYQVILSLLIVTCIVLSLLVPIEISIDSNLEHVLYWLDVVITVVLTVEFFLRVWSSTSLPRCSSPKGMASLLLSPIMLLDMFMIGSSFTLFIFNIRESMLISGLRGIRMLQFFENRYHLWRLVGSVFWMGRFQLAICAYFCFGCLIFISSLMYYIEQPYNEQFSTLGQSIWFTITTFTTVGYGDVVPASTVGRVVTGFAMLIGGSLFALPSGIIGAGLALKVEKEDISKGVLRKVHAAILIQRYWRYYLMKRNCSFQIHPKYTVLQLTTICTNLKQSQIILLKFLSTVQIYVAIRKFRQSTELVEYGNFYETLTRNYLEKDEKLRNIQLNIDRMNRSLNDIQQNLNDICSKPIVLKVNKKKLIKYRWQKLNRRKFTLS